jgi:hypothetical protein
MTILARTSPALLILVAFLVVSSPALADAYCSPTGDYCQGVLKRHGTWRVSMNTFSFRGRIQVCVTAPRNSVTCHRFRLRAEGHSLYGFNVRWRRHFPDGGRGRYTVRFAQDGHRIGKLLHFRPHG